MSSKKKERDWGFTYKGGNVCGTLLHGLKVGKDTLKEFEVRPSNTGDMFDAEEIASPAKPLAYRGALICIQMVRLGDIEGPIEFDLIRKLDRNDFEMLTDAIVEADLLGNVEPSQQKAGTSESSS